jgi:hypothetical protein
VGGEAGAEALAGLVGQLLFFRATTHGGEARQDGVALVDQEGAAPRDLQGVVAGLGKIGEKLAHHARRA